jgi:hypothetical protein
MAVHVSEAPPRVNKGPDGPEAPLPVLPEQRTWLDGRGWSVHVKVCGCRPHEGGAADTGAGVRKPPMEETAMGERMMVPRS